MREPTVTALLTVAGMAMAHVIPPRLRFIRFTPRSWILSAAGGVSVAYVFVHLLPEVAAAQSAVEETVSGLYANIERHAYLVALVGLAIFYGLERAAVRSRRGTQAVTAGAAASPATFWLSVGSYGFYNLIIGYLVVRRAEAAPATDVALLGAALGLHFVVNDLGLREHHRNRYDRLGRPLLVGALIGGWAVGLVAELDDAAVGLAVAFLSGGVILNVLKEELPEERDSNFWAFAVGATAYALLLLAA